MKLFVLGSVISFSVFSYDYSLNTSDYEALDGCEKREILWKNITSTEHDSLPAYRKLGPKEVAKLAAQRIRYKSDLKSDFSPEGWVKYLHQKSSVAKIKYVARPGVTYTGVFRGESCGLIRLSLTYKPTLKKAVAPGLALKIFRDKVPSANVSALYTLTGQGDDYNFFRYPLSNIVPRGTSLGEKAIHFIFSAVSHYPEELLLKNFGAFDQKGVAAIQSSTPRQIFFVANEKLIKRFKRDKHEIRSDFAEIEAGKVLYTVYALPHHIMSDDYVSNYRISDIPNYVKKSVPIGDIIMESKFIASEFGDTGIFFKHEVRRR